MFSDIKFTFVAVRDSFMLQPTTLIKRDICGYGSCLYWLSEAGTDDAKRGDLCDKDDFIVCSITQKKTGNPVW